MSDDVEFPVPVDPVIDAISGDDEVGADGGDGSVAKLGQTFLRIDHIDDDEDLCESCKWRERQLLSAAALAGELNTDMCSS